MSNFTKKQRTVIRQGLLSILGIVFCSLMINPAHSQLSSLPVAIPPGPTAASLGKYGDIPVGKYTGIPMANIPLFNFTVGKLDVPVMLNYSSSGLKVAELASWVGLGWSLNAGGVITRSVQSKPDESSLGYWEYGNRTNWELVLQNGVPYAPIWSGGVDVEPDIFYYNFLGRSGKFVMDAASPHEAHCIPFQNIKISHDTYLTSFTITDDAGNQFIFDVKETTNLDNATAFTSAWYLSKIITASTEIITFSYDNTNLEFTSMLQQSEVDYIKLIGNINSDKGNESSASGSEISTKVLKQIDAPGHVLKFYVSRARLDIPLCSILDSITVEDDKGILKKNFGFRHSYFGDPHPSYPERSRLKLDDVIEYSINDNNDKKVYSLSYYTPADVPPTNSKAQDYWGYYNGALNTTLLPAVHPVDFPNLAVPHSGGNREPVYSKAVSGVLQQIKYPTGGTSTFIYENNDYGFLYGAPMSEEVLTSTTSIASAVRSSTVNIPSDTKTFTLARDQIVIIRIDGNYTGDRPVDEGPTVIFNKINPNNSRTQILQNTLIHPPFSPSTQYLFLNAGSYEIIAGVDGTNQNASIRIDYKTPSGIFVKSKLCGGVRIKQIINEDPVVNKQYITNYSYRMPDDPNRSSGDAIAPFPFTETKNGYLIRSSFPSNYLASTQGSNVGYRVVTEFQSDANNITNGKTESYYNTYPINRLGEDGDMSAVINGDIFHPLAEPYKFLTDLDVFRGNLDSERVYNSAGIRIKETINTFNLAEQLNPSTARNYIELTKRKGASFITPNSNPANNWVDRYFTVAKVVCPWIYKTKEVQRIYDPTGINYLETVNDFFCDNLIHGQVTKIETTNSKQEIIQTINKYPQDNFTNLSVDAEQARQSLISKHIISPVLEQTVYKNSVLLTTSKTDYRNWSPTITLPEFSKVQNGTNPVVTKLQFYKYDAIGNIAEQSKADDIHEVYLWGYGNQYPVAKIVGTDYNTAIALVDASILQNPTSDIQLRTELNNLRIGLPNAFVTTYTYNRLVGISSESDVNNRVTYYEYDAFNRLSIIRDQDQNIIKRFCYNYAGQPENCN